MLSKLKHLLKSDNGVVLIGNVMASAFGLIIFMLLARHLTKSDFGSWAIFISTAGLLDLMRTGMVRQGMVRTVAISDSVPNKTIASAGLISILITTSVSLMVFLAFAFWDLSQSSLVLFFKFYPVLSLISLPWNFGTWFLHATGQYKKMNLLRLYVNIGFLSFIGLGYLYKFDIHEVAWGFIAANGIASLYALWLLKSIRWKEATRKEIKQLVNYGKHSLATLTGSNLLKSADNLIIGALMGTEAVAIFAIPMKALDLMEIPLRGFVMTAFRKLSQFHASHQVQEFKNLLFQNITRLTILCIPVGVVMLIIPKLFIQILGGDGYEDSILILRVLAIPLILLPLDKFLGASLDSIGKPKMNAIKVWIMVISNILGDALAIWLFESLLLVAVVTIFNIVSGIIFAAISHPYITIPKIWRTNSSQKSMVSIQSAKSQPHS